MSDPEEFNALRLIREGARATGDDEAIPNLVGGLHYWHSVASKARRENTELRATIDRLRDVRRSAVAEGHASPYLAHMIDQALDGPDPRRVATAEELDALPVGTIVRPAGGDVDSVLSCTALRYSDGWFGALGGGRVHPLLPAEVWLPEVSS